MIDCEFPIKYSYVSIVLSIVSWYLSDLFGICRISLASLGLLWYLSDLFCKIKNYPIIFIMKLCAQIVKIYAQPFKNYIPYFFIPPLPCGNIGEGK